MTIKKFKSAVLCCCIFISFYSKAVAWGPEGHAIVGRLALQFVKEDVKKNILSILGPMSIDTAAIWMDIMKSNADYEFMRPWHYVDFPKEQLYLANNNENIINRLQITYNELSHKKTLCSDQVKTDLLLLLHLMGDLHMPLHTGYDDDLGGNKRIVQYDTIKTHNLHTFWDEDIIKLTKITEQDCLQYYNKTAADTLKEVDFTAWMKDSRSLLNDVYDFPDFNLNKAYLEKNKIIVTKQLLKAGLRLALILNKIFYATAPSLNYQEVTAKYKNGIDIKDAINHIGKKVTVCSRVVAVRATTAITQISLGEKFPNCPLTIVVFEKNYSKFSAPLLELLQDKNVCIRGTVTEYKGKAQIIIEDPADIIVLLPPSAPQP